jgi:hypothetical protein
MTLKERCQAGEAKLERVSNALLDPRPEIVDYCQTELQEVIAILDVESAESPAGPAASGRPVPSDKSTLLQLRRRIHLLALQVQNAVNLCQGWAQLGESQGYTDQGTPAVPPSEPLASYEV